MRGVLLSAALAATCAAEISAAADTSGQLLYPIATTFPSIAEAEAKAAIDAGETRLAIARRARVELWSLPQPRQITLAAPSQVSAVAIAPSGLLVAAGCADGTVEVWQTSNAARPKYRLTEHQGGEGDAQISRLTFSSDGKRLLSIGPIRSFGSPRGVGIWDATTGKALGSLHYGKNSQIKSFSLSPDGKFIVVVGQQENRPRATMFSASDWKEVAEISLKEREDPSHVWVAPSSAFVGIAVGSFDRASVLVFDISDPALPKLKLTARRASQVSFSPDSKQCVTSGVLDNATVWNTGTGEKVGDFLGHEAPVRNAVYSPDGRFVLTASKDWTVRGWTKAGEPPFATLRHEREVSGVIVSPKGSFAVSFGDDGARVWDLRKLPKPQASQKEVAKAPARKGSVPFLRFEGRDHVELEETRGMLDLSGDFTIEMWARWDMTLRDKEMYLAGDEAWEMMSKEVPADKPCGWVIRTGPVEGGDKRHVQFNIGATIAGKNDWLNVTTPPLPNNAKDWQHLAVSKSRESLKLFWNGKLASQVSCSGVTFHQAPTNLYLGVRKNGWVDRQFHGDIRAFRVTAESLDGKDFKLEEPLTARKSTLMLLDFASADKQSIPDVSGKRRDGRIAGAKPLVEEKP